jgi:hypothetical protein
VTAMGERSSFKRFDRDSYDTPAKAVAPLLPHLNPRTPFIESRAGAGRLLEHLPRPGHVPIAAFDVPVDARCASYDVPIEALFATNPAFLGQAGRSECARSQFERPSWDMAADARRLVAQPVLGAADAATWHDREHWPREVDRSRRRRCRAGSCASLPSESSSRCSEPLIRRRSAALALLNPRTAPLAHDHGRTAGGPASSLLPRSRRLRVSGRRTGP